jgi:hypothetical protein
MRVVYLPRADPRDFGINVIRTRILLIYLRTPLEPRIGSGSMGYMNTDYDKGWI